MKYLFSDEFGRPVKGDFHVHTVHSDGDKNYLDILYEANQMGLEYVAFTDHNNDEFDSWREHISTGAVKVITGCELSVNYKDEHVHLLAYNYKPMFKSFAFPMMYKAFAKNKRISLKKMCKLIHLFGGVAVLAHPFKYACDGKELVENVIKEKCLDGIECIHPYHTEDETVYLLKKCEENDVAVTYGSDYHSDKRFIDRGEQGKGYQKGLGTFPLAGGTIIDFVEVLNEIEDIKDNKKISNKFHK